MKWPKSIVIIRHGQSEYNILKDKKGKDPEYQEFKRAFERDHQSPETKALAEVIKKKYTVSVSDYKTPLTEYGIEQAFLTGKRLSEQLEKYSIPDVILCSPYVRTVQTLAAMRAGWADLKNIFVRYDDRVREQEHGLSLLYNDWRLFNVFHPEQKALRDLQGPYWYQFPQGESVSQVHDRIRSIIGTLIREWAGKNVWLVTHHLTILSFRASMEHLTPERFVELDEKEKPVNCGVTKYKCNPDQGKNGKMEIELYNKSLF